QTCRQCKKLFRADHVWEMIRESEWPLAFADAMELKPFWQKVIESRLTGSIPLASEEDTIKVNVSELLRWAKSKGKKIASGLALVRNPELTLSWLAEHLEKNPDDRLDI